MRIRSTTVDGHQFTRVRRGYDSAEVDAVMARIADTLRDYEDQAEDLESRIAAAETAARVARPKQASPDGATEAARAHAGEIMRRAEEEAARRKAEIAALLEEARREAEELRLETEQARVQIEADRTAVESDRRAAQRVADDIREQAETDAHAIRLAATREAQSLLTAALDEARALRADAARDAAELRAHTLAETEDDLASQREELERVRLETAEREHETVAVLRSVEADRRQLEGRLERLRNAVGMIEDQMQALAGEIAAKSGAIDEVTPPADPVEGEDDATDLPLRDAVTADPATDHLAAPVAGFETPEEYATTAIAEPSATIVVDDDTDVAPGSIAETHTSSHHHAYADPDGSGRPPADRATIVPDDLTAIPPPDDHHGPDRTVYQRAGRNLRARLRREGQDPTQRGR